MKQCALCKQGFDPETMPASPEVEAGLLLTEERFGDLNLICADCLASRGRLAMMYDPECRR